MGEWYSLSAGIYGAVLVENMTLGQCSITAFLAQDIFGGDVIVKSVFQSDCLWQYGIVIFPKERKYAMRVVQKNQWECKGCAALINVLHS